MKDSKFYNKYFKKETPSDKIWVTKLLLSIIFLLSSLIYVNFSTKNKENYTNNILEDNISFTKINDIYDKYIGETKKENNDNKEALTINENLVYTSLTQYNNSTELTVSPDSPVNILKPGIIVYIGEKDDLGNTVIVQGNDGVDIWYSNILVTEYSLYDYVTKNDIIGTTNSDKLYLTIEKNDQYLTYEEYFS